MEPIKYIKCLNKWKELQNLYLTTLVVVKTEIELVLFLQIINIVNHNDDIIWYFKNHKLNTSKKSLKVQVLPWKFLVL